MEAGKARRMVLLAAVAVATAVSLSACGGGGGGGNGGGSSSGAGGASSGSASASSSGTSSSSSGGSGSSGASGSSSGSSSGAAVLNHGLSGVLYYDTAADYAALDLASGLVTTLRPKGGGASASYDATPSADASQFALVQFKPLSGNSGDSELDAIAGDGRTTLRIEQPQTLAGPAKLSPDKSLLIVDWYDGASGESCCIASIFDRSGKVVQRYSGYSSWDWLPGGGLLLAKADSIYKVDGSFGTPQLLKQFPKDTPDYLAVSPDGSRVAFDLGDATAGHNHVWTMNIDGSGLQQLSDSALNEDGASWSPDGKFIALRYAVPYSAISGGVGGVPCPTVYILPSSAKALKLDAADPAPAFAAQQPGANGGRVCAFTVPNWRATPTALPASAGSAVTGLSGKLLFKAGGSLETLAAADGTVAKLAADASADFPYYSFDGSLLAYVQQAGGDGASHVTVDQANGSAAGGFTGAQPFLGPPKIAPGNHSLAILYLGSSGSAAGKQVVQSFSLGGSAGAGFTGAGEYDWLPDGRLLLAAANVVGATTDASLGTLKQLATLPDVPSGLAASPDGTRLAFAMAGHVWTLHSDGTGLSQLTVSAAEEALPAWSPNGKYLTVQYAGTCAGLVVVPADGQRVYVGNAAVAGNAKSLNSGGQPVCVNSAVSWH